MLSIKHDKLTQLKKAYWSWRIWHFFTVQCIYIYHPLSVSLRHGAGSLIYFDYTCTVWSSSYQPEALQCLSCCVCVRMSCLFGVRAWGAKELALPNCTMGRYTQRVHSHCHLQWDMMEMSDLLWEYTVWSSSYKTEALKCLGCCVWVRKSCLLSVINCGLHGWHDQFGSYQQCRNEEYHHRMEALTSSIWKDCVPYSTYVHYTRCSCTVYSVQCCMHVSMCGPHGR